MSFISNFRAVNLVSLATAVTLSLPGSAAAAPSTTAQPAPLKVDVYTASPAGFKVTSTLISGERDAVLVDAQFTLSDAHRLTAMILESGKNLTTIFVTHAHPDHFFGLEVVKEAFPKAKIVAVPSVVRHIKDLAPKKLAEWKPMYGANLTNKFIVPEPLAGQVLELEGRKLPVRELGAGESEFAAVVYIPEVKTLIAGDLIFNGIHLWLAEGRPDQWLANLQAVRDVGPIERVVAGHKQDALPDSAELLAANARYIREFEAIIAKAKSPAEALAALKTKYSDFQLEIIAQIATQAALAGKK